MASEELTLREVLLAESYEDAAKLQEQRIAELEAALQNVLIGGNHAALLVGADHPPYQTEPNEARLRYAGRHEAYEAWCCWRTIMRARDVLDGRT